MANEDDGQVGLVLGVLAGVIVLVISLVLGIGLYRIGQKAPATAAAAMAVAPGGAASVAQAASAAGVAVQASAIALSATNGEAASDDAASVRVDNGVVKFYFASGKAELAAGAAEALGEIVKGVAAGKKAVISGYHDTTGDPAKNEELAKQRAQAVRAALVALGIGDDKLVLKKPEVTTANGSNAEARRVEVTLE